MIEIRSPHLTGAEVSWFAPLCSDDYRYLGVPDNNLKQYIREYLQYFTDR